MHAINGLKENFVNIGKWLILYVDVYLWDMIGRYINWILVGVLDIKYSVSMYISKYEGVNSWITCIQNTKAYFIFWNKIIQIGMAYFLI